MLKSQFGVSFPADAEALSAHMELKTERHQSLLCTRKDGGPGVAPENTAHNSLRTTGLEDGRGKRGWVRKRRTQCFQTIYGCDVTRFKFTVSQALIINVGVRMTIISLLLWI